MFEKLLEKLKCIFGCFSSVEKKNPRYEVWETCRVRVEPTMNSAGVQVNDSFLNAQKGEVFESPVEPVFPVDPPEGHYPEEMRFFGYPYDDNGVEKIGYVPEEYDGSIYATLYGVITLESGIVNITLPTGEVIEAEITEAVELKVV